jgi:serine/threonine protein kinase
VHPFEPTRFGHFVLLARLGRGGMAEVFRARREGLPGFERNVVVKRILSAHHAEPAFVQMLINEAKIAARLTHPNIVQVYELGETQGELFIAMELVDGRDLLALLRRLATVQPSDAALPPVCAAFIAREVCRGLHHAHEHKDEGGASRPIIHRDISPQNIMLSFEGQVKLVDFGIAKALDGMKTETRTGVLKGKVAYLSPEQVSGLPPSPQSDIFAVGVVLHEMLTGRRLFKGPSEYDTMQNVRSLHVKPPSLRSPTVPPALDAVVLRSLERDLGKRYASAADMVRDLDGCLALLGGNGREELAAILGRFFPRGATAHGAAGAAAGASPGADAIHVDDEEESMSSSLNLVVDVPTKLHEALRAPRLIGWRGALTTLAAPALAIALLMMVRASAPRSGVGGVAALPGNGAEPGRAQVRVSSDPPGAQVYVGDELLGAAPLDVPIGAVVRLSHPGWLDRTYALSPGDAPAVLLRLERRKPAKPRR